MIRTLRMPAALVASLCLSSIPLLAQHARSSAPVSVSHAAPRISAPHMSAPRTYASTSRTYSGPARTFGQPSVVYAQSRGGGHASGGVSHGTAVVRGSNGTAVVHGGAVYRGGYYGGGYYYGHYPVHYSYPYYTFHSHFSVGFGVYVGYPIGFSAGFYYGYPYYGYGYYPPYPYYSYPYPYYPPAPAYGYPAPYSMTPYSPQQGYPADPQQDYPQQPPPQSYPQQQPYPQQQSYPSGEQPQAQQNNSMVAQPGTAAGGISFDISPATAAVVIDGTYVGRVSDLGPTTQPMGLKPGRHHIEIRAPGYETVTFDADIVAGQVLPYKGQMQPVR